MAAAGTDWEHPRAGAVAAADHPGSGADRAGTVAGGTDRRGPGWPRAMATTSLARTDAAADRVTDGSDQLHWVASDIAAAAGMEYTVGCFPVVPEVVLPGVVDLPRRC